MKTDIERILNDALVGKTVMFGQRIPREVLGIDINDREFEFGEVEIYVALAPVEGKRNQKHYQLGLQEDFEIITD